MDSLLHLHGLLLLNLDGGLPLPFGRMKSIDQLHGDIDLIGFGMLGEFGLVPFGNETRDAGILLDFREVVRDVRQKIIDWSSAEALLVQRLLPRLALGLQSRDFLRVTRLLCPLESSPQVFHFRFLKR